MRIEEKEPSRPSNAPAQKSLWRSLISWVGGSSNKTQLKLSLPKISFLPGEPIQGTVLVSGGGGKAQWLEVIVEGVERVVQGKSLFNEREFIVCNERQVFSLSGQEQVVNFSLSTPTHLPHSFYLQEGQGKGAILCSIVYRVIVRIEGRPETGSKVQIRLAPPRAYPTPPMPLLQQREATVDFLCLQGRPMSMKVCLEQDQYFLDQVVPIRIILNLTQCPYQLKLIRLKIVRFLECGQRIITLPLKVMASTDIPVKMPDSRQWDQTILMLPPRHIPQSAREQLFSCQYAIEVEAHFQWWRKSVSLSLPIHFIDPLY